MQEVLGSQEYWMGVGTALGLIAIACLYLIATVRNDPDARAREAAEQAEFAAAVEHERRRIRERGLSPQQQRAVHRHARRRA